VSDGGGGCVALKNGLLFDVVRRNPQSVLEKSKKLEIAAPRPLASIVHMITSSDGERGCVALLLLLLLNNQEPAAARYLLASCVPINGIKEGVA